MIRPESLTATWLTRATDAGAWSRGSRYFRDGHATLSKVEHPEPDSVHLVGSCRGTARTPYRLDVEIYRFDDTIQLSGVCSCPLHYNCKHVVALVLTWQALAPHEARNRDPVDDWWAERPGDRSSTHDSPESMLYILDRRPSHRPAGGDEVVVGFSVARQRKDGTFGKGRLLHDSAIDNWWQRPNYLRPLDDDILGLIRARPRFGAKRDALPEGAAGQLALMKMAESGRTFWGTDRADPFRPGDARALAMDWKADGGNGYRLQARLRGGGLLVPIDPPCYVDPETRTIGAVQLPDGVDHRQLDWLITAPPVPAAEAQKLSRRLARSMPGLPTPVEVTYEDIDAAPAGELRVAFDPDHPGRADAELLYRYDDVRVAPDQPEDVLVLESGDRLRRLARDRDAEQKLRQTLVDGGLEALDEKRFGMGGERAGTALRDAWLDWLQSVAPGLREAGWTIDRIDGGTLQISDSDGIDAEVDTEGGDWFRLRFDLEFDGWTMPLLPLVRQLLENYQPDHLPDTLYVDAGDGHFVRLPAEQVEPVLRTLLDLFDRVDDDALQLARPDAARLLDLDDIPIRGATSLKALGRKLKDFSGLERAALPTTFKGQLRDYQQHGVDWLQFLRAHEFGGILADDMGLGKTVQALAHLAIEKRAGRMQSPCLIVAPTSLMGNWQREAAQFTPKLNTLVLHGPDRSRHFAELADYDLVLTTYPLLPRDRAVLLEQPWHLLILDEAQQLKNPRAQAAQVARKLDARHRLCLTGTPMENHLGELWAQFDLLMPGFLGSRESFTRSYRTPIEKHNDTERLQQLNRRIAPFLLRRTKDRVAAELPAKTELIRTAEFDSKQARLYEGVRLSMEKKVREAIAAKGLARSHIIVLEALMKLRQVCCDPRLLPKGTRGADTTPSAKFTLLFDLLPELLEEGRRVLLFSQFTTMLGLIEKELDRRSIRFTKLTGQTRKRDAAIERFRSGEVNLFLISLRAGGVGLNLVEADTVIHYDPWWNPAVEHQATDRAHRIGQDKPVFVYKLLTEGTVEEKILALQKRKHELAASVIGKGREQDQPPIDETIINNLLAPD